MPEGEFIAEIAKRSGCELLVDINNLYVNSQNHHFDATEMLKALPSDAIRYYHIAGHLVESDRSVAGNTAVESNKSLTWYPRYGSTTRSCIDLWRVMCSIFWQQTVVTGKRQQRTSFGCAQWRVTNSASSSIERVLLIVNESGVGLCITPLAWWSVKRRR